jgi:HK97 family phage prohead protease
MTDNDTLDYTFEFRSLDEKGHFTGMASAYGIKDSYDSIFDQGSLEPEQLPLPLTYQHDWNQMLGGVSVFENRSDGPYIEGDFDLSVARAREIYSLAKKGIIKGLSHRFNDSVNEYRDGVRHITHAKVSEITLTPIPSNKQAGITSLRSKEQVMEDEETYDDYNYTGDVVEETRDSGLDTSSGWDAGAARAAWRKAATGADGKVDLSIYGRGFLVKGSMMSDFKFPIGMPTDGGQLKVVCSAVHAAETRLEGSNVSDKAALAARIETLAKKCGFRDKKDSDDKGADDTDKERAASTDTTTTEQTVQDEDELEFENADQILQELDERLGELNTIKDSLTRI